MNHVKFHEKHKVLTPRRSAQGLLAQAAVAAACCWFLLALVEANVIKQETASLQLKTEAGMRQVYQGSAKLKKLLEDNLAEPRALATADFDEDGTPDLIGAYAGLDHGILTLTKGNADAVFPNTEGAQQRKAAGKFSESPFLPSTAIFACPEIPDFIGAGDFDADGHMDVLTARRGSRLLHLLTGNGSGKLNRAIALEMPGAITSVQTGEINRVDGLADIVASVNGPEGAALLIFQGRAGAWKTGAETVALPEEAADMAFIEAGDDYLIDVAVAAGPLLLVVQGHDKEMQTPTHNSQAAARARVESRAFPLPITALAVGDFLGTQRPCVSLLLQDGSLHTLSISEGAGSLRRVSRRLEEWQSQSVMRSAWTESARLVKGRFSGMPADDLIVIDSTSARLDVVKLEALRGEAPEASADKLLSRLDLQSAAAAVLPMRLNADALTDLVVLRRGANAPVVMMTVTAMTFTVTNTNSSGPGSLTQAIIDANANPGLDLIAFNIPGPGLHIIEPTPPGNPMPRPSITDPVIIDGTTQPGYAGEPLIGLRGNEFEQVGLHITSGNSTVRALDFANFIGPTLDTSVGHAIFLNGNGNNIIEANVIGPGNGSGIRGLNSLDNLVGGTVPAARNIISGNVGPGIQFGQRLIDISNGVIQGNFIGTNKTGTVAIPNRIGVVVFGRSVIGGTSSTARNLISGNSSFGIQATNANVIQGNFIGTNITGTQALPNGGGVNLDSVFGGTLGGPVAGARNIISGNQGTAVALFEAGPATIENNFIGTDVTGTQRLGNSGDGVIVFSLAANVRVRNNVISANGGRGVRVNFAARAFIENNLIGTDVTGTLPMGNAREGVSISFDVGPVTGNTICANGSHGVLSEGANTIQRNFIGTNSAGALGLGNHGAGVHSNGPADRIGGALGSEGNTIAFNNGNGVEIGQVGFNSSILSNSIFANGGLGIDLGIDGPTANDPCDADEGANGLQNHPVLTSAISFTSRAVHGVMTGAANTTYRLQFFANAACDPSGFGEGQRLVGTFTVTTNASCQASFVVILAASVPSGQSITATATDPSNNTSEFSRCVTFVTPQAMTQQLIDQVNALVAQGVINAGNGNALTAKLQAALKQMDKGHARPASNQLQAFINQVEALVQGGKLTSAQGEILIQAARAISAALLA
jgi:hypothetical protein